MYKGCGGGRNLPPDRSGVWTVTTRHLSEPGTALVGLARSEVLWGGCWGEHQSFVRVSYEKYINFIFQKYLSPCNPLFRSEAQII